MAESLDTCPLCDKRMKSATDVVGLRHGEKLLFYAHRRCYEILDSFVAEIKALVEE